MGKDDAPILAAALKSQADYLVTWNTRDFMTRRMPKDLSMKIRTPGGFVEDWTPLISKTGRFRGKGVLKSVFLKNTELTR